MPSAITRSSSTIRTLAILALNHGGCARLSGAEGRFHCCRLARAADAAGRREGAPGGGARGGPAALPVLEEARDRLADSAERADVGIRVDTAADVELPL